MHFCVWAGDYISFPSFISFQEFWEFVACAFLAAKRCISKAAININLPAALRGLWRCLFLMQAEKRWGRCFIIKSPRGDCISAGEVTQNGIPAAPFIIFHRYDAALFYCFINPSARWLYNNRIGAEEEKIWRWERERTKKRISLHCMHVLGAD